ncbi:MAG: transglutaminase domain-containing protein [Candidatus Jordarchaeales archaeon]
MTSSMKKALTVIIIVSLLVSAVAAYSMFTNLNSQKSFLSEMLELFLPEYFHHVPYLLSSQIFLRADLNQLLPYRNPPPFKVPEELRNIPIDYVPPFHGFASGLASPDMEIMMVEPRDPNYPHQYWKVSTFDYYGEGDWFKTQLVTYPINLSSPSSLPPTAQFFTVRMNLSHDVFTSTVLPTLYPDPYFMSLLSLSGDLINFTIERDDYNNSRVTLIFTSSRTSEIVYEVAGIPPNLAWIAGNALPAQYTPPAISSIYTQLPSQLVTNPTFTSFAQNFRGVGRNAYELAQAVQAELLSGKYVNNITLLLNGRPLPNEDPVVAFLKAKEGTCIDFASTFVTTLRHLGVSARLVIGYYDGYAEADYSGGKLKYIIRAYNIHAWAEVWVPTSTSGSGVWVPFDPTPPPTITAPSGTEWFDQQFNIPPDLIGTLGPITLFSYGLRAYRQVFNATPEVPSTPLVYWRLKAFDHYDGDWKCSNRTMYELQTWSKTELENLYGAAWYYMVLLDLEHQVNLTAALPFPFPGPYVLSGEGYTVSSVQGDMASASLFRDSLGNLYLNAVFTRSGTSTIRYTVATYNLNITTIRSIAKSPSEVRIPQEIVDLYLQIPSDLQSNEVFTSFVRSVENGTNAYETALNVLNRLTSGEYIYDFSLLLNGGQVNGDPVLWLLTNKTGTPVLFASTFVMALRSLGIPARLVVGYLTVNSTVNGNVVHIANSFLVHAWAEVWIPTSDDEGYWVSFDPTPEPLPPVIALSEGLLWWERLPRSDPNVQHTNFNVSIYAPPVVMRENPFDVTVAVTKDMTPQNGLLVGIYVYDPWEKQQYYKGSGTTSSGSVTIQIVVGREVKVGNLTVIAKVHSSEGSSLLVAYNYTAKIVLNDTVSINATVKSTKPALDTDYTTLIRGKGTVKVNGTLYDPNYNGTVKGIPFTQIQILMNGSTVSTNTTDYAGHFEYSYPNSAELALADYTFQVVYQGIFGTAQSPTASIKVYAQSYITLALNPPNAVKNGTSLSFTVHLSLDSESGSPIEDMANVYVNWNGNEYATTYAGDGNYICNVTVNVPSAGYYDAYAYFGGTIDSGGRILPSQSVTVRILVYNRGLIFINSYSAEVYRGEAAWFSGFVTDEYGNPAANITLQFKLSNASYTYSYNASKGTDDNGFFNCSVPTPRDIAPGVYDVHAVSLNDTFSGVSNIVSVQVKVKPSVTILSFFYSSVSTLTISKQTSNLIGSFMPGERAFIIARVVDSASREPLGGLNFTAYYNGLALSSNTTDNNGYLNIILEPEDLSSLPLNQVSMLVVEYPGNETFGPARFEVKVHVFNNATIEARVPTRAFIGKPLTISVNARDPNGNPLVGRNFTVYWNMSLIGSFRTDESGNGVFTFKVPDTASEGYIKLYVTADTGNQAYIEILLLREELTGGYILVLLNALQVDSSSLILPLVILGVLSLLLIILLYVYVSQGKAASAKKPVLSWNLEALDELAKAGNYREAVMRIYKMYMELLNVYLKVERLPNETARDVAKKAVKSGLPPKLANTITQLFEKARFSRHAVTDSDYKEALKTLNEIYKEVTGSVLIG